MWYIGWDRHLRTSTLVILDQHGQQVKSVTLKGDWPVVRAFLSSLTEPLAICYEASCGYGYVYDELQALAQRVLVAHPGQLRLIFRSKRKNDRVDAGKLAKLLYLDALPVIHVPAPQVRTWRELIEFRRHTVDKRTRVKNGLRALLRTYGISPPKEIRGLWSRAGHRWLAALDWAQRSTGLRCQMLLEEWTHLERQVSQITQELNSLARSHPGVALLKTIPGVGWRTAEAVVAYIDQPSRFAHVHQVGAYFGLVPCQDQSAGKNRLGHITKEGPGTVRKLLLEAAWQGIRRDAHLRAYFERIVGKDPDRRKIAVVATAHHLVRCMLAMLRDGRPWRPEGPQPQPTRQAA